MTYLERISNRATKFRLKTAGLGGVTIYAKLFIKDGTTENLEHELELCYPDGTHTYA